MTAVRVRDRGRVIQAVRMVRVIQVVQVVRAIQVIWPVRVIRAVRDRIRAARVREAVLAA